jgi:oxysterol-binding protein-related protein 3/6/7
MCVLLRWFLIQLFFWLLLAHHHHANEFGANENGKHDPSQVEDQSAQLQRIRKILDTLTSQHDTLLKSLQGISALDTPVEEEEHASPASSRKRSSIASDSVIEWFDASEGAEEFVLDETAIDPSERPSQISTNDSASSIHTEADAESIDTDSDSDESIRSPTVQGNVTPATTVTSLQVVRRTTLPAPITGDEGSLFAVLKKNVGKVGLASALCPKSH